MGFGSCTVSIFSCPASATLAGQAFLFLFFIFIFYFLFFYLFLFYMSVEYSNPNPIQYLYLFKILGILFSFRVELTVVRGIRLLCDHRSTVVNHFEGGVCLRADINF